MKFLYEPIKAKDLKPGDLFSVAGPLYWDQAGKPPIVAEKVFIRTETPCSPEEAEYQVYRIIFQTEPEEEGNNR